VPVAVVMGFAKKFRRRKFLPAPYSRARNLNRVGAIAKIHLRRSKPAKAPAAAHWWRRLASGCAALGQKIRPAAWIVPRESNKRRKRRITRRRRSKVDVHATSWPSRRDGRTVPACATGEAWLSQTDVLRASSHFHTSHRFLPDVNAGAQHARYHRG